MKKYLVSPAFILIPVAVFAQWNTDSTVRNIVCNAANNQYYPHSCSDGHGGAIFCWVDERPPNNSFAGVYIQRISAAGTTKWANNGIPVYEYTSGSSIIGATTEQIVPDDAGGAIVLFEVSIIGGANHIYAQRFDSSGNKVWTTDIPVATNADSRLRATEEPDQSNVAADGSGGIFITWQSYFTSAFIRAQHIRSDGTLAWGGDGGIGISPGAAGYDSHINSTGNGTAIVTYSSGYNLYIQQVDASGNLLWGINGILVSSFFAGENGGSDPVYHSAFDGTNFFIAYVRQASFGTDLYAQKFDLAGTALWSGDGKGIAVSGSSEENPFVLADNKGGIFIAYDSSNKCKVQHVNQNAVLKWGSTGITVDKSLSSYQLSPVMVADGTGGIIVSFYNNRPQYTNSLFAQRYDISGNAMWETGGIPVITNYVNINHNTWPLVASEPGFAIACWTDERNNYVDDIYAAKFGGATGVLPLHFLSFNASLQQNAVILTWSVTAGATDASYTLQRSADDNNFMNMLAFPATDQQQTLYTATDKKPLEGNNFYRIKATGRDGRIVYSPVRTLVYNTGVVTILFPNPVHDKLNIAINAAGNKTTGLLICNASGQTVAKKEIKLIAGSNNISWNITGLAKGMYFIKSEDSSIPSVQFVKD